MTLFCASIGIDPVCLLKFAFRCHVQFFSCEILPVYSLRYPFTCFSSHFWFLLVFLLIIMPFVVVLVAIISLSLPIFMKIWSPRIDATMLSSILSSSLLYSFRHTYILCISSLRCKGLYIFINFLVPWTIYLSSFPVHFKNDPVYLARRIAQVFISSMRFLLQSLVLRSFLVRLRYSFFVFFNFTCLIVSASNIPKFLYVSLF